MAYTPKPGSLAARAVEHLQSLEAGAELTTGAICDALDTKSSVFITFVTAAVSNGLLRSRREGNTSLWSLGDGPAETGDEEDEETEFNAALWADGDLVIYGAQENVDGSITLNAGQVAQVKKLIAWSAVSAA